MTRKRAGGQGVERVIRERKKRGQKHSYTQETNKMAAVNN